MPESDVHEYRSKGYTVTRILTPGDVELVLAEASRIERLAANLDRSTGDFNLEAPGGGFAGQDGSSPAYSGVLRKASNVVGYSSTMLEISRRPSISNLAKRLIGAQKCRLAHSVVWYKPARIGSPKPPHQDAPYLDGSPEHFVTIWIALDDCTMENGCLEVVPGSHVCGPAPHEGNEASVSAGQWNSAKITPVPLAPGMAIAFHPWLLHASRANRSTNPRRALMLRYVG